MLAPATPSDQNNSPLFPEIGIVTLPPDEWQQNWQTRHQVVSRLARYFHVVWMNPPADWRDALRDSFKRSRTPEPTSLPTGLHLYEPKPWLPHFYRPQWLANWTFRRRLEHARNLLLQQKSRKILLYLWRPEFSRALDLIPFDLSCYHIDDEYSFSSADQPISGHERRLLERVNQVFIHSPALLEKKGKFNPNTEFVPNGVDYISFSKVIPPPADVVGIPHPRVGYTGYVKKQLDLALLLRMSKANTNWQFVIVGEISPHPEIAQNIEKLRELPNVHFLGAKSTTELAAYPQHFDVCIMPYVLDGYTRYIYPLKLHEYLASGRPIVGTRIPSLEPFADVVCIAENDVQWEECIAQQLLPEANHPTNKDRRQSIARQHDWDFLVERIARNLIRHIEPQLGIRLPSSRN
jgi:glycosyltransferase involved in cell wall biosynthesis